jgi:hypothetical protein
MFRWAFIIFVLIEVLLANVDNLLSFDHSHPMLFALGTGLAIFVVFTPAVLDWHRAVRREQQRDFGNWLFQSNQ